MKRIKQTIVACLLSAMLVSSLALPVIAVEESDGSTVVVESTGGGTETEETSVVQGSSKVSDSSVSEAPDVADGQNSKTDTSTVESELQDESVTVDESSQDTSKSESTQDESSKDESSKPKKEIKRGKQTISVSLSFNTPYATSSLNTVPGYIDFSGIKISVLSNDKSKTYKQFVITDTMLSYDLSVAGITFDVEVPDWGKNGITYYLRAENLPTIYPGYSQDIPIVCQFIEEDEYVPSGVEIDYSDAEIDGVGRPISVQLQTLDFNSAFFVYDIENKSMSNINMTINCYNAQDKVVCTLNAKTTKDGVALVNLPLDDNIDQIGVSISSVLNNSIVSGEKLFDYDYLRTCSNAGLYIISADTLYDDTLYDDNGNKIDATSCKMNIDVKYMDSEFDSVLFEHSNIGLGIYSNDNIIQNFQFSPSDLSKSLSLISGRKYTAKSLSNYDYDVLVEPTTIVAKDNESISVVAKPRLTLTVINKENGVSKNAHFKISGVNKEYNEQAHKFAVNCEDVIIITNLDSNEVFDIVIDKFTDTVVNIADGDVSKTGYIGDDSNYAGQSTSSGANYNIVTSVPKTGDIILGVGLTLCGLTTISYVGYEYFKRKGKKANEKKN